MGIFVTFAGYKDGKVRASGKAGLLQVGYALVYEDSGFSRSQHGGASDRDRGFDECRAKIFGNAVGHEAEVEVCGMVRGHRGGVVRPFYLVACQIVNAVVRDVVARIVCGGSHQQQVAQRFGGSFTEHSDELAHRVGVGRSG